MAVSDREALPRLVLVYGGESGDHAPLRFAEAANGVCTLVWVVASLEASQESGTLKFLERLGEVVDVAGMSAVEAAASIGAFSPDGIVCFVDSRIAWTSQIAQMLELEFHSPQTADRLTDKLAQRSAFREHRLPVPEFWDIDCLADEDALGVVIEHGFPLVLKPRRGTSSQDTERISDEHHLRSAVMNSEPGRMLLESYIPDPVSPKTGEGSAPYVSVELLVLHGVAEVLGITGRTPLADPFRETGFLLPADVPSPLADELIAAAVRAIQALGVETGALHVELKCTDRGPVVIEVNGRPGGAGVHFLLRRALGIDTVQLAMRIAVGEQVHLGALSAPEGVVFRLDIQPDASIRTITTVEGLEAVLQIPGVDQVVRGVGPGDEVSWRTGTLGYAAAVLGAAPDHPTARRIRDLVLDSIVISGTP